MSYTGTVVITIFLTLLVTGLSEVIRACNKIDHCKCQFTDDHSVINLWPLVRGNPPVFKDYPGNDGLEYSYSPCRVFDEGDCKDGVICQKNGTKTTKLAEFNVTFRPFGKSVSMHYEYNDDSSMVYLTCNVKDSMPLFEAQGRVPEKGNSYVFNITTEFACALYDRGESGDLGAGDVILIIFFVVLFLYLLLGVLDAKFRKKATGLELIPHIHFWSALPGLISDGFGFVITCSCLSQRSKGAYDEV